MQRLEKRPYSARVDFQEPSEDPGTIYIGLGSFTGKEDHFLIYDWRASISSIYYDGKSGKVSCNALGDVQTVDTTERRQFLAKDGEIINIFDASEPIGDQVLLSVLNEESSTRMKSIVTMIQCE